MRWFTTGPGRTLRLRAGAGTKRISVDDHGVARAAADVRVLQDPGIDQSHVNRPPRAGHLLDALLQHRDRVSHRATQAPSFSGQAGRQAGRQTIHQCSHHPRRPSGQPAAHYDPSRTGTGPAARPARAWASAASRQRCRRGRGAGARIRGRCRARRPR